MSVFTDKELARLREARLARIATVGPDGQPHVVPLTFTVNEAEDAVDVGGFGFGTSKKWRDALRNPKVTFLLDESSGGEAYGIELRCTRRAARASTRASPASTRSSSGCARTGSSPGAWRCPAASRRRRSAGTSEIVGPRR